MNQSLQRFCNPIFRIAVRHGGGGGGRPGGRPAFNWKEKKLLGLGVVDELKPWKNRPSGHIDDLIPYFDSSRGDQIIDLSNYKGKFVLSENVEEKKITVENHLKTVQVARLFGPNKAFGMLPDKLRHGTSRREKGREKKYRVN